MVIKVYAAKTSLGRAAAEQAAISLCNTIQNSGRARVIAATGAAQFEGSDLQLRKIGRHSNCLPEATRHDTVDPNSYTPEVAT